ncbi:MAG TPA: aminotransferase class I/II-fold pyridoxal phosphate-dependent enzyme [Xanthobacteraceae bacterium]|nr:aminotransferase class I/II-fold pyridoxal phosphate-dependent enzyme [Xanthobacteraceae bacterium]
MTCNVSLRRLNEDEEVPARISRLRLPERVSIAGTSARRADLELLAQAPKGFLDTTHFDTVRFPPPPWAIDAFNRAAMDGHCAYTPYRGNQQVLETVAATVSSFLAVDIDPKQNIILTPGTQAALFASIFSLVEDDDRVVLLDPDYLFYARMVRCLGADIAYVPLHFDQAEPRPDLDALEHEFRSGARTFILSHPNNPTGAIFGRATVSAIAKLARQYGVRIVVDELYSRLLHAGRQFHHLVTEPGMFDQTITLLGPSKTESMSGYRVGVVIAPARVIARIEDVQSVMSLRAPAYAQHVLVPWLRDDHEWLDARLRELTVLRDMTFARLRTLPWLKLRPQGGTAYAWCDVATLDLSDSEVAAALLRDAGVLVSPGYQFGPRANGHFRVCYARDEAAWSAALDQMIYVLAELARK